MKRLLENKSQHSLDDVENLIGRNKTHFQIKLSEFRLSVGAQIFVAKTAGNLKITVETGDHQKLFINLRGLRQSKKFSFVYSAGNEIIARSFGSAFHQNGRFDFVEILPREKFANRKDNFMTQENDFSQFLTPQIKITVFQPQIFIGENVLVYLHRKRLGIIQKQQFFRFHFDFAGFHIFIDISFIPHFHRSRNRNHIFVPKLMRFLVNFFAFGFKHNLNKTGNISQIDECQTAEVSSSVNPSH